jgi:ParB-like chromosome segregation protein Spo0J
MAALRASIESCGYVEPIAINTDGTILSGHARKKILIESWLTEVDVRVPERALTDAEQREVLIRMNKNTAGEWDMDILANEFEIMDLKEWDFTDRDLGMNGNPAGKEYDETVTEGINLCTCHCGHQHARK